MRQILRGLETLHDAHFVHSDVKPANVMIDRLGYVKIIDYGRAVKTNEPMTILFGSPLYMAPEVHRREANLVQSDIYSVGLLGLEMLRGEPLLHARGLSEKDLLDFKMKLPGRLHELLPDYVRQNDAFVHLIRRLIEPDPADRFGDAEEAESGNEGLRLVHQQLVQLGKDTEYGRELQGYMTKLVATPDAVGIEDFGPV
jgi:serine/threonine protein kinase